MFENKRYNIFLSHSWSYSDSQDRLLRLFDDCQGFNYNIYSVPDDDPLHKNPKSQDIYEAIKNQICICHIVLIMEGHYEEYKEWIDKEIHIAKNEFSISKPIIAVRPLPSTETSKIVTENANEIVNWTMPSVIDAIRRQAI